MQNHSREKLEGMISHVGYEIGLLTQTMLIVDVAPTLQPFAHLPAAGLLQLGHNLRLETMALHACNLAEFLLGYSTQDDAVLARHYLVGYRLDKRVRREIEETQKRAHIQIAHLSTNRIGADKRWTLDHYYPVLDAAGDFAEALLKTDWFDNVEDQRPVFEALLAGVRTVSNTFKVATGAK